ncbi:uncharacterized protein LOC142565163 isoform X1 [Dermacentor variabilis]|uniref:uncharacterized protein LOC142565163 isoform X1 n=1 Tax=Dermacentor variabilis TaxID=34621 RepID=UPI003F5C418D
MLIHKFVVPITLTLLVSLVMVKCQGFNFKNKHGNLGSDVQGGRSIQIELVLYNRCSRGNIQLEGKKVTAAPGNSSKAAQPAQEPVRVPRDHAGQLLHLPVGVQRQLVHRLQQHGQADAGPQGAPAQVVPVHVPQAPMQGRPAVAFRQGAAGRVAQVAQRDENRQELTPAGRATVSLLVHAALSGLNSDKPSSTCIYASLLQCPTILSC